MDAKITDANIKCLACARNVATSVALYCITCKNYYHYQCLNVTPKQFASLTADFLATWICPSCKNITRRNKSNATTPVMPSQLPTQEDCMDVSGDLHDDSVSGTSFTTNPLKEVTMDNISALLDQKLKDNMSQLLTSMKESLKMEIKEAVKAEVETEFIKIKGDLTATTDFFAAEQKEMDMKMQANTEHLKKLESQKERLSSELRNMENRLSSIERLSRSFNLEIQAVPESRNENVNQIVIKLCELVNAPITETDIRACRRVAKMNDKSTRPRNILVTLSSPLNRDRLLSATHRYNKAHPKDPINSSALEISGNPNRIYVVEHVSPECKQLHAAARLFAKDKGYKYVWLKYGRVYLRKDDSASCIHVKNRDSLDKL